MGVILFILFVVVNEYTFFLIGIPFSGLVYSFVYLLSLSKK